MPRNVTKLGGEIYPKTLPLGTIIGTTWDKDHIALATQVEAETGRPICGAKRRQFDENDTRPILCRQYAGAGTDHPGEGRCKSHGGRGGGVNLLKTGRTSILRHRRLNAAFKDYLESQELMDIRNAVAASWAVINDALGKGEETNGQVTMDEMTDVINALHKVSTMVKQHHDITEGQRLVIEVPQFMEWSEHLYTLAIRYIQLSGGDVRGFLVEAQAYFSNTIDTFTGISAPALGAGNADAPEDVL